MNARLAILVAAVGSVLAALSVHAGPILLNGDFSDGKTHWHGAGDPPAVGGNLVITLKPDAWTVVRQNFSAKAPSLKLQVKYSLSDDCTIGRAGDKLLPPLTRMGLEEACGLDNGIYDVTPSQSDDWLVLLVSGGNMIAEQGVYGSRNGNGSSNVREQGGVKTFTTTVSSWNSTFDSVELCLCFPPGKGSVTLNSVALTPPGQ